MKNVFLLLLVSAITTMAFNKVNAQNYDDKKFVQFVFTNLETREQALEIDKFVRLQEGVFISRADINSKKYLIIYYSDSDINLEKITIWMDQFEKEFKCTREGIHGIDKIIDQNINCEQ